MQVHWPQSMHSDTILLSYANKCYNQNDQGGWGLKGIHSDENKCPKVIMISKLT